MSRCGFQRAGTLDPRTFAGGIHGFPQIAAALDIQPEIGAIAEHPGQDQRGRGGYAAAIVAQFVDMLALYTHRIAPMRLASVPSVA